MTEYTTKKILQHLINISPQRQEITDFHVSKKDKQKLLNKLFELSQRDLIEAKFSISRLRKTYGEPQDVKGIFISKNGWNFMDKSNNPQNSITQNITIEHANGSLNIAGNDINITNGADADKFIERLLNNIEKSNLPSTKREGLLKSVKTMVTSVSSSVLATLISTSLKGQ